MEPYHNAYLHKGIHDFALGHGFVDHEPSENVIMHPTGFDRKDGAFNPVHRALLPPIETLTEEQRSRVMFAMIPPMMPLGLVPDHMFYFLVLPNGANEISLRISICVPPSAFEVKNFDYIVKWIVDGVMMYNDQDVGADTAVQKGLRSQFAPRGRFSWKETTIVQLNRWLVRRYRPLRARAGPYRSRQVTGSSTTAARCQAWRSKASAPHDRRRRHELRGHRVIRENAREGQ